jgi:hypothetical protein
MASHASSGSFEMFFARFDGTIFKCVSAGGFFANSERVVFQETMLFLLDTVEDLSHLVPRWEESLPRHPPVRSLEMEYQD